MERYWRYLIPAILTLLYIGLSTYAHFSYLFLLLLLANFLNAVSYTHLDVYKRQVKKRAYVGVSAVQAN